MPTSPIAATQNDIDDSPPPTPAKTGHLPGDGAMWFMVLGDLVIFGAYFLLFMVYRTRAPQEFLNSQQHLSLGLGVANTLVLLTSSWFVARGVLAARGGNPALAIRMFYGAGAFGIAFLAIKAYEWTTKIVHGYTNATNDFFMIYYMMTGIHAFHLTLGLLILGIAVNELRVPHRRRMWMVEAAATYWHMVDLLWIVIFALLYVMR